MVAGFGMDIDEAPNGWQPDPLRRFDERYIVYGEPSRLVRDAGVELTDRLPLTPDAPTSSPDEREAVETVAAAATPGRDLGAVRRNTRRRRISVVSVVLLVAVGALVVSLRVRDRNGHRAASHATGRVLPSGSAFVVGASPPSAPHPVPSDTAKRAKSAALAPALEWAEHLESDVNNVHELAVDDGPGTLEELACQRTRDDARRLPATPSPSRVAEVVRTTSALVVKFGTGCLANSSRHCAAPSASCPQTRFLAPYRESLRALNALEAELTN